MSDLLKEMQTTYDELKTGKIGLREANGRANIAGKILGCVKVQLEYNQFTKTNQAINFLENGPQTLSIDDEHSYSSQ